MLKKVLIGLLIVLVVIQFIRPAKNQSPASSPQDIAAMYDVPQDVQDILARACNDCHTNFTSYPWYSNIQPVGWWLQHHINEGKEHLNFSVFRTYSLKKQAHKLEEVAEEVEKGAMPLESYIWVHKGAALKKEDALLLANWAKGLQAKIEQQ